MSLIYANGLGSLQRVFGKIVIRAGVSNVVETSEVQQLIKIYSGRFHFIVEITDRQFFASSIITPLFVNKRKRRKFREKTFPYK